MKNHKGTRMAKDGEDWHGLQTTNLKNRGLKWYYDQKIFSLFSSDSESVFA